MRRLGLLTTFIAALAILTWDEVKTQQRVPKPEVYWHAVIVWAVLGVVAELGVPELAALFGFGYVLSMLYRYYQAPSATIGGGAGSSVDHSGEIQPAQ